MTASNIAIREFLKSRPIRQPQGVALADAVIVAPLAAIRLRARRRLLAVEQHSCGGSRGIEEQVP
jgi:hypothetical protein